MAFTYEPIATTTTGGGTTSYTFSSIPNSYTDLILVSNLRAGTATSSYSLRINSDSGSNYSNTILYGSSSGSSSTRYSSQTSAYLSYWGFPTTASTFATTITEFLNYSNTTTNKTFLSKNAFASDGIDTTIGLWRSTNAIDSITVYAGNTFASGCVLSLYGIKAA